jgi:hypothetical protein
MVCEALLLLTFPADVAPVALPVAVTPRAHSEPQPHLQLQLQPELQLQQFFALLGPLQTVLQGNMRLRILKSVPLLAKLTDSELSSVADALCVQSFEDGDYVIRQGEEVRGAGNF